MRIVRAFAAVFLSLAIMNALCACDIFGSVRSPNDMWAYHWATYVLVAGGTQGSADGVGSAAQFSSPQSLCWDGTYLYVADTGNHSIRRVAIATGAVTTIAGTSGTAGYADGTGSAALFNSPAAICTDGTNLYVADTKNNRVRKIVISTGVVTTLAGSGTASYANGTGTAAAFSSPAGVCWDGTDIYVGDAGNKCVRKITTGGVVSTIAGNSSTGVGSQDGTGSAALFSSPGAICSLGWALVVNDDGNGGRLVTIPGAVVTTLKSMYGYNLSPGGSSYDGSHYLYCGIYSLGKLEVSSTSSTWYAVFPSNSDFELTATCCVGSDVYVVSSTPPGVYKLSAISSTGGSISDLNYFK